MKWWVNYMQWESLNYSKSTAEKNFNLLLNKGQDGLASFEAKDQYQTLRNDFVNIQDKVFEEYSLDSLEKQGYLLDLSFGIEMYQLLNSKYDFSQRDASNDEVWRFLQLEIIPDLVYIRWGGFNAERFYSSNRRLWLKSIWWYIHLSWKNNADETFEILKGNSTDTIMQLVERPGQGYNMQLYREIMYQYKEESMKSKEPRAQFRQVLILNNARIPSISPELSEGEITEYVHRLFKDVNV